MLLCKRLASRLFCVALTVGLAAAPYRISLNGVSLELIPELAVAQGNSGGGGGPGNGGGSGGGSGQGGGSGNGGAGAGGQNNNMGKSGQNRPSGKPGVGRIGNTRINPKTGDIIEVSGSSIKVRHRDGMAENIENDRYEMQDAKGRTIINRRATEADRARLRAFMD